MVKGRGITDRSNEVAVSGEDVVRRLFAHELVNLVENDRRARSSQLNDDEAIHQLRVSTRRLRAKLQVVGWVLSSAAYRDFREDLGDVGAVLGELRNLGVLEELYEPLLARSNEASAVHERLDHDLKGAKRRVQRCLESRQYRRVIERLASWTIDPPLRRRSRHDAAILFAPRLWTMTDELFAAVDAYGPQPTLDQLHRIRKLAKSGRYNFEVASWYLGEQASEVASTFEELQSTLGELHDLSVAVDYLEPIPTPTHDIKDALSTQMTPLLAQWRAPLHHAQQLSGLLREKLGNPSSVG